ncbi:S41 family peptidase [Leptospira biflexa]|uniref:S41 family peptidase n=1 Tax=Leptospira biflexa TaxID=172 RepID=UPI0010833B38|nr:S41 family peptidase [Leptospira biflexa]TGM34271.1 peptidase S41 [Leptospira biflexa]TGM40072.1 peptidase S41 [Leptospira biflexa]TGM54471.1 peptidase S41 [Leptospira biflexa]
MKFSLFYISILSLFFLQFTACKPAQNKTTNKSNFKIDSIETLKKESKYPYLYVGKINLEHFIKLKNDIHILHLTSDKISTSASFGGAIKKAYQILSIDIYPKSFYDANRNHPKLYSDQTILPTDDHFFIRIKQKSNQIDETNEWEPKKRRELYLHFTSLNLDFHELEKQLDHIYTQAKNDPILGKDPNGLLEKIIFLAMLGYTEEIDPHTRVYDSREIKSDTSFNVLNHISHRVFFGYPDILYIKIKNFIQFNDNFTIASATKKIIEHELNEKKKNQNTVGALLIDLRESEQANLIELRNFLSLFTSTKNLFSIRNRFEENIYPSLNGETILWDGPIGILVGPKTTAGGELVAGSLRENKNAVILGTRTFGQGTFQMFFEVGKKTGYFYAITNSKMYLPSGEEIQGFGIIPDINVENPNKDLNPPHETKFWNWIKPSKEKNPYIPKNIQTKLDERMKQNSTSKGLFAEENPMDIDPVLTQSIEYYKTYLSIMKETK